MKSDECCLRLPEQVPLDCGDVSFRMKPELTPDSQLITGEIQLLVQEKNRLKSY